MILPLITDHRSLGTFLHVKKEQRGHMATQTATTAAANAATAAKTYSAEEKMACSLDAMMNGGECEACQ